VFRAFGVFALVQKLTGAEANQLADLLPSGSCSNAAASHTADCVTRSGSGFDRDDVKDDGTQERGELPGDACCQGHGHNEDA
jgi:hypothetical protein